MSYSFSITADTKDEAGVKVEAELAKVVEQQPSHEVDRQAAQDAAEAFIDVLADPKEHEHVKVAMWGSVFSQSGDITHASVQVNASIEAKPIAGPMPVDGGGERRSPQIQS